MFGKSLIQRYFEEAVPAEFEWMDLAMDADAYRFIENNLPEYIPALERAAELGGDPAKLRQFIVRRGGQNRSEMAKRMEQALRHIRRMMDLEGPEDEPAGDGTD